MHHVDLFRCLVNQNSVKSLDACIVSKVTDEAYEY